MKSRLYFDSRHLPLPKGEYVAWCDAMGTSRDLTRSFHKAAHTIFHIQAAFSIAQTEVESIRCYPMMDGVYVTCPSSKAIVDAIRIAFSELAMEFIGSTGTALKHMVRGGLASKQVQLR